MQDLQTYQPDSNSQTPAIPSHVNAGTSLTEQSRAVAEAMGKIQIAKQFPRDENVAYTKIMAACSRAEFAKTALYAYPKGGQQVEGPSIRMAEMLIRCWTNVDVDFKELSQKNGESEIQVLAWDKETNTTFSKTFVVKHERATKHKTTKLTDSRDIYEVGANNGARRQRAVMLAIIPDDIIEEAKAAVKRTLAGSNSEPIADRIRKMTAAFSKHGVTQEMLEKYLGYELDLVDTDGIVELMGIFNSINSGDFKPSQYFSDIKKKEEANGLPVSNIKAPPPETNLNDDKDI